VIGELLIALLLLAVAVSSLAALMYSVARRPSVDEKIECVGKDASSAKCLAQRSGVGGATKLLRSGCATRAGVAAGVAARECRDTLVSVDSSGEVVLRPRTDSVSLALLEKKEKEKRVKRPNLGFVR